MEISLILFLFQVISIKNTCALENKQVQFHPGSSLDGHVVVLSSDNYLRIYNVDEDRTTPEQSVSLSANNSNRYRVVQDHLFRDQVDQ